MILPIKAIPQSHDPTAVLVESSLKQDEETTGIKLTTRIHPRYLSATGRQPSQAQRLNLKALILHRVEECMNSDDDP